MHTLRELQMLVEQHSEEDTRKDLNRLVDFFLQKDYRDEWIDLAYVKARRLPKETADEHKVFFVDEETSLPEVPEEFRSESLGFVRNGKLLFAGRLVYPVMDVEGNVAGLCGWDKFAQPKYLDSVNHTYKAKNNMVYGMEKMREYYDSNKPLYVVEGIPCCHYLRSRGFNSVALLGSKLTTYMKMMLSRFGRKLVVIPDNDAFGKTVEELGSKLAGEHFVQQSKRDLPNAVVIQTLLAKDVDDARKVTEMEDTFLAELRMIASNPFIPCKTIRVR